MPGRRYEDSGKTLGMSVPKSCFGYPLSIFFIVVNEFCERFSYYGMRALLILYFQRFLGWNDNLGTAIYHTFVALCYLTPILGALIADSWLGKFKTIVSLSIVYTIGQVVVAVSSINDLTDFNHDGTPNNISVHVALSMIGLVLIALGTGGIKPCVSAFGGDQFEEGQEKQRNRFFSIFYLAINAGSLLSTIITPMLREISKRTAPKKEKEITAIHSPQIFVLAGTPLRVYEFPTWKEISGDKRDLVCGIHSKQACYPLAFGVPAALMAVSLIVFVIGSGMYKKVQPQGNIMSKVARCIGFAIKNRISHRSKKFPKREHWLDWASEKYDERLISQIKMVTRVMFLYIPLPMFWALFDQQGIIEIQPDQMQTVNAILIVIMVPIVDAVVYPLIAKCGLNFTSLKKMTVGMFLASMAFVAAAIVQVDIDKTLPVFPKGNEVQIKVLNIGNNSMTVSFPGTTVTCDQMSQTNGFMTFNVDNLSINISSTGTPVTPVTHNFESGHRHTLLVWAPSNYQVVKDGLNQKPEKGRNGIRFVNAFGESFSVTMDGEVYNSVSGHNASEYLFFSSGVKSFTINSPEISQQCEKQFKTSYLEFGSAFTYVITRKSDGCPEPKIFEDISPNTVSMALQIPQYFLLTCGEVVFSITGLEFSYSQAPSNMKSVLQAGWLLTVAVGNIIVLIVAGAGQFSEQWAEYVLFAALLLVVCIIFAIMARFYTYVNPAEIEAQFDEDDKEDDLEKSNPYAKLDFVSQTQM